MSREDEQAIDASSTGESRRVSGGGWALIVAGVLVAYPLSLGPVAYVFALSGSPDLVKQKMKTFYEPLWRLGEEVPVVGDLLGRWVMLGYEWGGGKAGPNHCD